MKESIKFPSNLRTHLLSLPNKRRQKKKYKPPVYRPGYIYTGVAKGAISGDPVDNWRLNQLAKPTRVRPKWVPPPECIGAGIPQDVLQGSGTQRTDHLCLPPVSKLEIVRKLYKHFGNPFLKNIDKYIAQSWKSIYYFYAKQRADQRRKSKPTQMTKAQLEELEQRIKARCAVLAVPKPLPPPPAEPPRKKGNINAARMTALAEPRTVIKKYIRPSLDSTYLDPLRVRESAKKYEITARVLEISKSPPHRLLKEEVIIPGSVKRGALHYKATPRIAEIATPKKKAAEKDSDLKENPFEISKNAMKYKASPRILELAKPIER